MQFYRIDFSNVSLEVQEKTLEVINRVSFLEPKQESDRKYTFYLDNVKISSLPIPQGCVVSEIS